MLAGLDMASDNSNEVLDILLDLTERETRTFEMVFAQNLVKELKGTTMTPATRKLMRVAIDEGQPGDTSDLVERLRGKKPELRFQYIQENARFVEKLDV